MKLQEARTLIKTTFEYPFDKDRFTLFVRNLLKDAYEEKTFVQTGGQLPQAFANLIRKMERIGKYEDDEGNIIDILLVELKKGHSIEWARTTQRNFIRRYLNGSRGGELKDAALVAFYSEGSSDWRFSLIKMQYSLEKKKDELTPAKRFSFLVGEDEKSHTAQNQLAELLTLDSVPTLVEIESAFNIETVTKEFFEKYRELFLNLNDHINKEIKISKPLREELKSKGIDSVSFTKKLLGQIVFLYFLQKKGWLGVPKNENWNKGDKQFLRTLLTKALDEKKNFFSDYLVYLFYEALATEHRGGSDPSYYAKLNCRIPFLNGGLFEADYDWKKIDISIPNRVFTNTDKSEQGDIGTGVLDVFDRYNFTVKEDEPLEKQIAVDPEMLGKVFENLLEIKDRKSKGAFYTPREIVHYMCQESLIAYLDTAVNGEAASYQKIGTDQTDMFGNKARIGQLPLEAEHGSKVIVEPKDIERFIREGISAIDNDTRVEIKGEETQSYTYLIPESIRSNSKILDDALASIRICDPAIGSGAFPVGMMNEIVKAREILSVYLRGALPGERTPYELKRHAIQECIYGVDVEHSAIDIAKLRLWLSLVVDEDDFYKIKPLPNLDYKIVEGSSIIGLPDGVVKNDAAEKELEKLKEKFFSETDNDRKKQLRLRINSTIQKLLDTANEFVSLKVDFDFKLFFSEVYHEKNGFDVIIGNPPYISYYSNTGSTLSKAERQYFVSNYDSVKKENDRINSMNLFSERAVRLLRENGYVSFIVNKTFAVLPSYIEIRKYFLQNTHFNYIISGLDPFEAIVDCVIYGSRKTKKGGTNYPLKWFAGDIDRYEIVKASIFEKNPKLEFHFSKNSSLTTVIEEAKGKLEDILTINRGVNIGGCFDYFLSDKKENDKYFKFLTGIKSLKRFTYEWDRNSDCFFKFDQELETKLRNKGATIVLGNPERYLGEKLFIPESAQALQASFVSERIYSAYGIMVGTQANRNYNIKYACALLNSKLFTFYAIEKEILRKGTKATPHIGVKGLNSIPVQLLTKPQQEPFLNLVDYILFVKSRKESDTVSQYVTNDFISNYFEKILDGCVYEIYFKEHMQERKIDILKYVGDYITPFAKNDTVSKKADIVLKAFNKLNQSDNIIRNRLLLFATRSEDIIMIIEKSISR